MKNENDFIAKINMVIIPIYKKMTIFIFFFFFVKKYFFNQLKLNFISYSNNLQKQFSKESNATKMVGDSK